MLCYLINAAGKNNLFIDIGSNIGFFPLVAADFARSNDIQIKIYAHEPYDDIRECALALMKENHLYYNLDHRGVGQEAGNFKFYISAKSDASNSFNGAFRRHKDVVDIEVTTIDITYLDMLEERGGLNVVLMVDVETLEPQVLRGGVEFIKKARPSIICEVLHGRTEQELSEILEPLGYDYFRFNGARWVKEQFISGDKDYKHRDWIFLPRNSEIFTRRGVLDFFTFESV